jgi:Flp pilus assembly protein protease CpaA
MSYNAMKRNILGLGAWFLCALVINVLALIPMYLREQKQSKEGGFAMEWDDVAFYGFAILCGSGVNVAIIQYLIGG